MGRLDLPDKPVDWISVTTEYLNELYREISDLRADRQRSEEEKAALRARLDCLANPRVPD